MAINTSSAPLILSLLLTLSLAATAAHHAAAPPPADCSTVILNLADCLSYVTDGSTVTKPEGKCCSGLKTVLKSNPECLCEGFKNSAQFGVTLNVTKALDLPSACHVSAPSVSNCGLSLVPGAAPAIAPIGAVSPSSIASPPTTSVVGANELAPAPAPGTASDSTGLAISVGSLLVVLMVSMLSFI